MECDIRLLLEVQLMKEQIQILSLSWQTCSLFQEQFLWLSVYSSPTTSLLAICQFQFDDPLSSNQEFGKIELPTLVVFFRVHLLALV